MIYKVVLSEKEFSDNEAEIIKLYSFDTLHYVAIYEENWCCLPDHSVNTKNYKQNKSEFYFFGKLFPDDFFKKHPYYVISFIVDKFTGEYLPHPKGFPDDFLCFYSLNDYGYVAFSRGNNLESLCKKVAESISKKINTNQITRAYSIICVDIPKITTSNVTEKPICLNFEL